MLKEGFTPYAVATPRRVAIPSRDQEKDELDEVLNNKSNSSVCSHSSGGAKTRKVHRLYGTH